MAKMSRDKGKRGELEVAALLKEYGFEARRGQQFKGTADSPDVIHNLPWPLHMEVKYVERLNLNDAMAKAEADSGHKAPLLFSRRNGKPWLATMKAGDFLRIMSRLDPIEGEIDHGPA